MCPFDPVETYHFLQYEDRAQALWDLLAKSNIGIGSIDKYVSALPKAPSRKGKPGWLFKPDRTKTVDQDFLEFLDGARTHFAKSLVKANPDFFWGEDGLNEAVQRVLDRILFIRICEDRDIDTFSPLSEVLRRWMAGGRLRGQLYPAIVSLFRQLAPVFNGGLFGKYSSPVHFSESLTIEDGILAEFVDSLSSEDSNYLFSTMPVDILGSVYERFLGKVIRLTPGKTVKVELKPEVRKSGGIYYTPRHVVNLIVNETVGHLVKGKTPSEMSRLKIVDPACGSGSFLMRAFERICEQYLEWYLDNPKAQKSTRCYHDSQNVLRLTTNLKREILVNNIFGVDVDPQAVEVTQLSLYLKILEGETRTTLATQRHLFPGEAFLPDLSRNIQCENSIVSTDFLDLLNDEGALATFKPFDWQTAFPHIFQNGGFDAVIGNPPWISLSGKFGSELYPPTMIAYLIEMYKGNTYMPNMYEYFVSKGLQLIKPKGLFSFIVPDRLAYNQQFIELRRTMAKGYELISFTFKLPFPGITADTMVFQLRASKPGVKHRVRVADFKTLPAAMTIKQSDFLQNPNCVFEYFENASDMALIHRLRELPGARQLGELFETTSGFGGRSELIRESRSTKSEIPTVKGDSIRRYDIRRTYWFEFSSQNITGRTTDRRKLGATPKVLLRKTGDSLIATYDDSGIYPEQSLYFLFDPKSSFGFKPALALLNSPLFTYIYRLTAITNKNSIAQMKKVDLDRLPICAIKERDQAVLSRYVDQMLDLHSRFKRVSSESEKAAIQRMIEATETKINTLVYQLYGLTEEEVRTVELSVSKSYTAGQI